jgi:hypothetical protein
VQTIQSGWNTDPVHSGRHIYAKMALNLMERLAQTNRKTEAAQPGRKRTWSSASNNSSGSGESGGRQTPRSTSWRELRDSGRFNSSGQPRYQGEQTRHNTTGYAGYSGGSGSERSNTSYRQDYGYHGYYDYPPRDGYMHGGHRGGRGGSGGRR